MKPLSLMVLVWLLLGIQLAVADSRVSDISAEYQAIKGALPMLKEEKVSMDGYSTEGGEAKIYRDAKGNLRYMRIELYGEMGKAIEEYYVKNDRLIFMYREFHQYNVPFYLTPEKAKEIGSDPFDPKKTTLAEDRYYFYDYRMIQWIDRDKKEVSQDSGDFKNAETEVLNSFREVMSKVK
ncbi:MAG: hypothetical protein M0T82_12690 [Desulfobacteraceae bacterium]|nr:hypothetical protein [Desulfobacteraceae bacterium]